LPHRRPAWSVWAPATPWRTLTRIAPNIVSGARPTAQTAPLKSSGGPVATPSFARRARGGRCQKHRP